MTEQTVARRLHYQFVTRTLRGLVERDPKQFVVIMAIAGADALRSVWDSMSEKFPVDDRIPSDGFAVTIRAGEAHSDVVIRLPEALRPAEAHMVGVIVSWDDAHNLPTGTRYVALELGVNPLDDKPYTVLCEWTARGHENYGSGPPVSESAFFKALDEMHAGDGPGLHAWTAAKRAGPPLGE